MGAIFSALMSMLNSNQQHKLIIVGLDNAGKTTTLYKLHLGEVVMTQPTIGSNVEEVKCCLLYTSPSPRDQRGSRMPSSA